MEQLPDEILVNILQFLDSKDLVNSQITSLKLLKLSRDNALWRYKCFEKSPSAATRPHRTDNLASLTGALVNLSLSDRSEDFTTQEPNSLPTSGSRRFSSKRVQAVTDWDCAHATEKIDWYSEYIARHATLSVEWLDHCQPNPRDVRGLALLGDKVLGPLANGSLCIWDITASRSGRRRFREVAQSPPGTLFECLTTVGEPSNASSNLGFGGVGECISVDSVRERAYVAVGNVLNEVDLTTFRLISQQKYAWSITALSQDGANDQPLTVGTSWSLNLYDPRYQLRDRSRSPEDLLRAIPGEPEASIAFLPNYTKSDQPGEQSADGVSQFSNMTPSTVNILQQLYPGTISRQPRRPNLSDYARVDPGPLSILHQGQNDILIAGRFPSILSYDRRFFPRLQYAIHSGARLSALTSIPYPPRSTNSDYAAEATLVAAGEYGGRGSLELYSLPHVKQEPRRIGQDYRLPSTTPELGEMDCESAFSSTLSESEPPFSYKNRQAASASKLLAVATQGSRIVFSDAEGGLRWVERDGVSLVRRWNINTWEADSRGASVIGEQVVRKIVSLEAGVSERGAKGNGDLLIWTGERIGIVSTKPARISDDVESGAECQEEQEAEVYSQQMRHALERQADEARWMRRFRLNR